VPAKLVRGGGSRFAFQDRAISTTRSAADEDVYKRRGDAYSCKLACQSSHQIRAGKAAALREMERLGLYFGREIAAVIIRRRGG
jgi:hypothetical protein